MNTTALELKNIYDLAYKALSAYGCDHFNADSVATTVSDAERDGSVSHGSVSYTHLTLPTKA